MAHVMYVCVKCHHLNKKKLQSGRASWRRVCYQRGLPHLVILLLLTNVIPILLTVNPVVL